MSRPRRRSCRIPGFDYASAGAYFVTICAARKACLFGDVVGDSVRLSHCGEIVDREWLAIPGRSPGVELDDFVLMPNHLHGIVWLGRAGQAPPPPGVIGSFKSGVSRRVGRPVWQRSFHDRVIRDDAELEALRQYIADNPIKWAMDRENPNR